MVAWTRVVTRQVEKTTWIPGNLPFQQPEPMQGGPKIQFFG